MNFNRVVLGGRLTRDVDLKYTPSNMAVVQLGIAVNHKYKSKDGEKKEEVTFVDAEAWSKTAETIQKYFHKGDSILIEGRLKLDQWQDKDGGNRSKLKVVIESFSFVGEGGGKSPARQTQPAGATASHDPLGDDDLPEFLR